MRRTISVGAPLVAVASLLLLATVAVAQTTGQIEGVVVDQSKAALPGVTVEATSPALQGVQVAVADETGAFRLLVLPPGTYTVRCSLSGFVTVERSGIVVQLGRTVALQVQLQPAFEEHVTVTGAPPAIDVRSPEVGANISKEFFLALPMQRDYASVVQAVPGVTTDGSGAVVYGSTGLENVYYIDGVGTNNVYTNGQGKSLNFEFIQEVQVKTGGYAAEFGHSTGGVVNVITRSGGNEFHGDVFGYYFSDALQSNPKATVETFDQTNQGSYVIDGFRKTDVGLDLGGYLLKDKVWFFAAYNPVKNSSDEKVTKDFSPYGGPPKGKVYVADETKQLWSGKLTGKLGASHSLVVSAFGDPTRDAGPVAGGLNGEESTFLGVNHSGGGDAMLQYQGLLGAAALLEAQISRYSATFRSGGPGAMIPVVYDQTTPLYAQTGVPSVRGGLGGHVNDSETRATARLTASFFVNHLGGDHEIKAGAELERVEHDRGVTIAGPDVGIICTRGHLALDGCPVDWIYYIHFMRLTSLPPGGLFDPDFASYVTDVFARKWRNDNRAAFVQDAWRVTPSLTLNLGVRWEGQRIYGSHDTVTLDLAHNWSPRAGFVWDFRGDGASKLFGSWGRFYETIPLTLSGSFAADGAWAGVSNRDPASVLCDPVLNADPAYQGCYIYTVSGTPVDPSGVKGEFTDEAMLGVEVAASRDFVLGAKIVYRTLGRVIDDSLTAGGAYYVGNPGYGLLKTALDQSYTWAIAVPPSRRTFKGVELTATKRMSDGWQMMASYLWSKLEGNYDGNYYPDYYGQQMPNISGAYDYGEFTVHNDGFLSNDRRHQAKVAAVYGFPFGLTVGTSAYYRSGTPLSAIGFSNAYGNVFYLSQRGAWGRTAAEYEMDLHLGYPIKIGGAEVNLLLDVFHLLNRQGETRRDQSYNFDQTVDVIDYATGKPLPPIAPGTQCASLVSPDNAVTCNASFNTANAWQDPRSVRLGVRITF